MRQTARIGVLRSSLQALCFVAGATLLDGGVSGVDPDVDGTEEADVTPATLQDAAHAALPSG